LREAYERVALHSVAFSPNGNRILAGGTDGKLRFFDAGGRLHDVVLEPGVADVRFLSFFRDGSTLLAGGGEAIVLLETGPPPEGFEARARAREAREVVNGLFGELTFSEDVARSLSADTALPDDVRLAALELARARGDHIGWLNSDAVYGYRNRKLHRDALENFRRSHELYQAAGEDVPPEDLAFTAMSHWRLGERDAARKAMRDLESRFAAGRGKIPPSSLGSIQEARSTVGPGT
jgi:hypothetical protein